MTTLAQRSQSNYALVVMNGVDRGSQFKIVGSRVSIGRGSDNNICVKDDTKMSRNHAVLAITSLGIEIVDVSDQNKVFVNGEEVNRTTLVPGSIFQLGETKFQLKFLAAQEIAQPRRLYRAKRKASSSRNFYILVIALGALFFWLLTSNQQKKNSVAIRTDEDVEAVVKDNKKVVEDALAERTRLGLNSRQYEEAQPNFIKGFRDYRKGQYGRAKESFQACLSLFPNHIQCERYKNLSEKKYDELIQYHMMLANKYRAQNQFSACKAAYRNAMVMIANPSNKNYIEAKGGFEACDTLEGDRY